MFHKIVNLINEKNEKRRPLFIFCLIIFFFVLFDGIIYYTAPIIITESGISGTVMGFIIASSSIAGAVFDLILCRFFKNPNFRRLMLAMFILATIYPIVIYHSKTVFWFVVAMALWGFYYDLFNISRFDFIGRIAKPSEHASGFGILSVFTSLGYLLAPILAVLFLASSLGGKSVFFALVFLGVSFLMFGILLKQMGGDKRNFIIESDPSSSKSFHHELALWYKLGKVIFPVLIITLLINTIDGFFWTIGPLLSESFGVWGGMFMFTYGLPPLIVGWFVGRVAGRLGKKKTAIFSLFIGSFIFSTFFFVRELWLILSLNFVASFFIAIVWPSINGAYADYISEGPKLEKELETVQDYFTNLGYIIGPIVAGFLSDQVGHLNTFAVLGLIGMTVAIFLFFITPKQIDVTNIS